MSNLRSQVQTLPVLLIRTTHVGILVFVIFGWIFSVPQILIFHLISIPLVILQWKFNQGRCLLTDLENYFLTSKDNLQSDGFVKNILKSAFQVELTDTQLTLLMYVVMLISFTISMIKVFS